MEDYYGAPGASDTRTLGERLRDLYAPEDFVKMMNIDTKPVTYQFTGPGDTETVGEVNAGNKDTIMHRPPRRLTLQSGETKLCPAYEADMFFTVLVKQLAVSNTARLVKDGTFLDKNQPANWSDPVFQQNILSQAFLGKQDTNQVSSTLNTMESVDKDLDINAERPKVGRPRRTE